MSSLVALIGLLVAAFVMSSFMAGQRQRLLLPSGSEWILIGFVVGPSGLELVGLTIWEDMEPVLSFGIGWLGLLLGMFFGNIKRSQEPPRSRILSLFSALAAAALTFVTLSFLMPHTGVSEETGPLVALALTACGTASSRMALRWLRRYRFEGAGSGPRAKLLAATAQWDNLIAAAGVAAIHWVQVRSGPPAIQELGVLLTVGIGIVLGALGAALLGREYERETAWGTVLGLSLLAAGISLRLGYAPALIMFALGWTLTRLSPIRFELRRMVAPTEMPTLIVMLTSAGALIHLPSLTEFPLVLPLFFAVRLVSRWTAGTSLRISGLPHTLNLGIGTLPLGAMAIALALFLRFDPRMGDSGSLVLTVIAASMVLTELFGPLSTLRLLSRAQELSRYPRALAEEKRATAAVSSQVSDPTPLPSPPSDASASMEALDLDDDEGAHTAPTWTSTLGRIVALISLYAVLYLTVRLSLNTGGYAPVVAGLGFLILAGTLFGQVFEKFRLPHVTGYLVAGILAGPFVFGLVDATAVKGLGIVRGLAVSLLALEAGAELSIVDLRRDAQSLSTGLLLRLILVPLLTAATAVAVQSQIPFTEGLNTAAVAGVGLLIGVVGVSPSPAATLAVLSEMRAKEHMAQFSLATVVITAVGLLMTVAFFIPVAGSLIDGRAGMSLDEVAQIGHHVISSVAVGTTMGLLLGLYLVLIRGQLLLSLVVLGFVAHDFSLYLGFDGLIVFLVAGIAVRNITSFGPRLLQTLKRASVIMVIFFAYVGADLNLQSITELWQVMLILGAVRLVGLASSGWLAGRICGDPPPVRRWAWSGGAPQGGVGVGVALLVSQAFPQFGESFKTVVLSIIGLNLLIGPILYKVGLIRGGGGPSPAGVLVGPNAFCPSWGDGCLQCQVMPLGKFWNSRVTPIGTHRCRYVSSYFVDARSRENFRRIG